MFMEKVPLHSNAKRVPKLYSVEKSVEFAWFQFMSRYICILRSCFDLKKMTERQ